MHLGRLTLLLTLAATGCHLKGGGFPGSTAGTASPLTWESTAWEPKTIVLVDLRTGESVFEYHIPPGQQLSVQFHKRGHGRQNQLDVPNTMRWTVQPIGKWIAIMNNQIAVPAAVNRRIDVFIGRSDHYVYADENRPVHPLTVPLPGIQDFPSEDLPADPADIPQGLYAVPGTGPAGEDAPRAQPADDTDEAAGDAAESPPETPLETPTETTPETGPETRPVEEPATPAEPPQEPEPPAPAAASPALQRAAQTWGDTGHTRRVAVKDIRTGTAVFEVDVPAGHDLVLHFHPMWTPPDADDQVEAMHWEIVPSGTVVKAPAHHATVPNETNRQIVEDPTPMSSPPSGDPLDVPLDVPPDTPPIAEPEQIPPEPEEPEEPEKPDEPPPQVDLPDDDPEKAT